MTRYQSVADIDREQRHPDAPCTITFPYTAGIFARGAFAEALAQGRAAGLTIGDYPDRGFFVRRGHVHASGRWGQMRPFLLAIEQLDRQPNR